MYAFGVCVMPLSLYFMHIISIWYKFWLHCVYALHTVYIWEELKYTTSFLYCIFDSKSFHSKSKIYCCCLSLSLIFSLSIQCTFQTLFWNGMNAEWGNKAFFILFFFFFCAFIYSITHMPYNMLRAVVVNERWIWFDWWYIRHRIDVHCFYFQVFYFISFSFVFFHSYKLNLLCFCLGAWLVRQKERNYFDFIFIKWVHQIGSKFICEILIKNLFIAVVLSDHHKIWMIESADYFYFVYMCPFIQNNKIE